MVSRLVVALSLTVMASSAFAQFGSREVAPVAKGGRDVIKSDAQGNRTTVNEQARDKARDERAQGRPGETAAQGAARETARTTMLAADGKLADAAGKDPMSDKKAVRAARNVITHQGLTSPKALKNADHFAAEVSAKLDLVKGREAGQVDRIIDESSKDSFGVGKDKLEDACATGA